MRKQWAASMPAPMCWALRGPPGPPPPHMGAGMGAAHCMRLGIYIYIYILSYLVQQVDLIAD